MLRALIQFAAELIHALLIDELSYRIRRKVSSFWRSQRIGGKDWLARRVQGHNRERLLHKLFTGLLDDP